MVRARQRRRAADGGIICFLLVLGGCGSRDSSGSGGPGTTGSRPAPMAAGQGPVTAAVAITHGPSATLAEIVPHCPAPTESLVPSDQPADPPSAEIEAAMEADSTVIDTYGQSHVDEFGGIARVGNRLDVWFTDHLDVHAAALRPLVSRPDLLDVVPTRHSRKERQAIEDEIIAGLGANNNLIAYGLGGQTVIIGLPPGQEPQADALVARYGDVLDIEIGGRRYVPEGCGDPTPPAMCKPLVGTDPAEAGLQLTLVADSPVLAAARPGRAHLIIKNIGGSRFSMDPGQPIAGWIVASATTRVIGENTYAVAGTGLLVDLAPGEERSVDVAFGAGRCDGGRGSAVPPGTYRLRVVLTPQGAESGRPAYLSPEIPITVTP